MSDSFVGQIILVPFNFPPKGFAFCRGQLLPLSQNTALFALIGTTYGGNGQTNFALPNLQGRVAMHTGHGPGLSEHVQGESSGSQTVALSLAQIPQHTHPIDISALTITAKCRNGVGNQSTPVGNLHAIEAAAGTATYSSAAPDANMRSGAIVMSGLVNTAIAGESQGHENRQPHLALSFCIALSGVFPSRN